MTTSQAIERVLDIARNEIGYREKASNSQLDDKTANTGSANYTKYARDLDAVTNFYNGAKQGFAYCDVFHDWLHYKAWGAAMAMRVLCQPERSAGAGCAYSAQYYQNAGRWYTSNPQPGDQIFFNVGGGINHTGIIEKVSGSEITTIEGNTSDMVARRVYNIANGYIAGYGRPRYELLANEAAENKTTVSQTSSTSPLTGYSPIVCMMTQSTCYRGTSPMTVKGVLWHSTGANNPWLKRYVQPDDNAGNRAALLQKLGTNYNKNDWNHIAVQAGLNAWIGKLADGSVATVQTMPWNYKPWGCGGGCNNGWIQFECAEDSLEDPAYFNAVYREKKKKKLGTNYNHNDWNHIAVQAGLNAWIGKLADGSVATVQTMPWNYKPWGCGGGCNNGWIQFECAEDSLEDPAYFNAVYKEGVKLTAYLCKMYNINPYGKVNGVPTILCHQDSYQYGMGTNHADVYHWFRRYGKTMDNVRADVAALLKGTQAVAPAPSSPNGQRELGRGDKGDDVKQLQTQLIKLGYRLPLYGADGDFGAETDTAVRLFQQKNGLRVDGIVGNNTREKIEQLMKASAEPATAQKWVPAVGDIVNYKGNVHYISANNTNPKSCRAGKAKITQIYLPDRSKHPYHLVGIKGGSTVCGWVDAGTFEKV